MPMRYNRRRPRYQRRRRPYQQRRRRTYRRRQPVHYVKRFRFGDTLTASAGANTYYGQSFALSGCAQYTDLTDLFDQYKLSAVKVQVMPRVNTFSPSTPMPEVMTAIDYNDATAPVSTDELAQYSSMRITRGSRIHTRYFKPKIVVDAANTGLNTRGWLPSSLPSVGHFGLKYAITALPAGAATVTFDVRITYFLALRTVR